jgi:hypothetical protein
MVQSGGVEALAQGTLVFFWHERVETPLKPSLSECTIKD